MSWFSRSLTINGPVKCANCGDEISFEHSEVDLVERRCPHCGIECFLYTTWYFNIQIILEAAPWQMRAFIDWAQNSFDQPTLMEFIIHLQRIIDPEFDKNLFKKGEREAYREYLRGKSPEERRRLQLGEPEDPNLRLVCPRPYDFIFETR